MATINNDARKKQKRTGEAVDNGGDSSLTTSPAVVVLPPLLLSFGTIVKEFPDFLFLVLPYIADRMIWNSIATSYRDIYQQSKKIQPPWPLYYKVPSDCGDLWSWSPCGTRIACSVYHASNITIVDQRLGPRRIHSWNAQDEDHISDLNIHRTGAF